MNTKHLPDTIGAIAGVAFSALLFLSIAAFNPLKEATDAEVAAWWSDSGNLRDNVISMYLMLASVPFFLLFLATLRARLAGGEGGDPSVSTFMVAAGLCFAAAVLVAGAARGMIAQSVRFGDEPLPGPDTLRTATVFSQITFNAVAMPAAAITLAAASWLIVRSRVMAAWVAWSGFAVAGAIGVAAGFLVASYVLPLLFLWVTATSIELWRTQRARANVAGRSTSAEQVTS